MNMDYLNIKKAVIRRIEEERDNILKEEIERCKENVEHRIRKFAVETMIDFSSYVNVNSNGKEIICTIKFPKD